MKKILSSLITAAAIIVVLNAQDPAPVQYVASVKKNAGGFGGPDSDLAGTDLGQRHAGAHPDPAGLRSAAGFSTGWRTGLDAARIDLTSKPSRKAAGQ